MHSQKRYNYALHKQVVNFDIVMGIDRNYHRHDQRAALKLSTLLTVERGEKGFQWHFSITVLGQDGRPEELRRLVSNDQANDLSDYMVDMLDPVGIGTPKLLVTPKAFHMYKDLTAGERKIVAKYSVAYN